MTLMEGFVAFTVTFPTSGPLPDAAALASWLTEQGEPFEHEQPQSLTLRALPVRLAFEHASIQATVDIHSAVPLTRLVNLLFALSHRLGADVRLVGVGEVTRSALWYRFADEQDRLRIREAIGRSAAHNNRDELLRTLWSVLGTLGGDRDWRWDILKDRVVELAEVGAPGGITVEEAAWHTTTAHPGDTVAIPVRGNVHILAWRWLKEAYPSLSQH